MHKVKINKRATEVVSKMIASSLLDASTTEVWSPKITLPICQRQLFYTKLYEKTRYENNVPFYKRHAFHIHNSMCCLTHEFWGEKGDLWGSWRCDSCNIVFNNTRLERGRCIRCGLPASYSKKFLKDDVAGFAGYCDAIVFSEEMNGYLVFTIRARNSNVIEKAVEPYESDIYKTAAYAYILSRQHWLSIAGRSILWLSKSNSKHFKVWTYEGVGEELFEEQIRLKLEVEQKMKDGNVFERVCRYTTDAAAKSCQFTNMCFDIEE